MLSCVLCHVYIPIMVFFVLIGLLQYSEMFPSHGSMCPALALLQGPRMRDPAYLHSTSSTLRSPRCCPLSSSLSCVSFGVDPVGWWTVAISEQKGAEDCRCINLVRLSAASSPFVLQQLHHCTHLLDSY